MENTYGNSEKGSWFMKNWDSVGIIAVVVALTVIVLLIATNTNIL